MSFLRFPALDPIRAAESARSTAFCSCGPPRPCSSWPPIPELLGARTGVLAVLHTWGQNLQHHPHVHCVVPGGGLAADGSRWIACRPGFFLPVRVLSRVFRRSSWLCSAVPLTEDGFLFMGNSPPSQTRASSNSNSQPAPEPSGSSMPNRHGADPSRSSSTCLGTPTAWRSVISDWSAWKW